MCLFMNMDGASILNKPQLFPDIVYLWDMNYEPSLSLSLGLLAMSVPDSGKNPEGRTNTFRTAKINNTTYKTR